jgi:hypothetical protein
VRVRDVLVGVVDDGVLVGYAFAGGHGEVGEEGDCCDEGCEGVEKAGLLLIVSLQAMKCVVWMNVQLGP